MKSTVNEQFVGFSGTTAAENADLIKIWMSEEFGWIVDGDNVYFDEKQKVGFYFSASGATLYINPVSPFVKGANAIGVAIQTTCFLRYHVSAGKSVVYLSVNDTIGIVAALDEKGNWYSITSYNGAVQSFQFSTNQNVVNVIGNTPSVKAADLYYSITKVPSFACGGSFSELFFVVSAKDYNFTNQLVRFNEKTYRLAGLRTGTTASYAFAFPVEED